MSVSKRLLQMNGIDTEKNQSNAKDCTYFESVSSLFQQKMARVAFENRFQKAVRRENKISRESYEKSLWKVSSLLCEMVPRDGDCFLLNRASHVGHEAIFQNFQTWKDSNFFCFLEESAFFKTLSHNYLEGCIPCFGDGSSFHNP